MLTTNNIASSPVLDTVSWETYQHLRRELDAAHSHVRITFDQGRMFLMSPLPVHEGWKSLMGRFVDALADHMDLGLRAYGSATWQREDLARGLEPDECFYIQSVERILGIANPDLESDPPPDLAIEIIVTHNPLDRMAIYAGLGIPEVWQYDGERVECFILEGDAYRQSSHSLAFPEFRPAVLHEFMQMFPASLHRDIIRAFKASLK